MAGGVVLGLQLLLRQLFKQLYKVLTVINVRLRSENSVEMAKPSFYSLKGSYLKIADRIKIGLSDHKVRRIQ